MRIFSVSARVQIATGSSYLEQGSMMNRGDGILEPANLPYVGENGGVFFLEYR